MLDIGWGMLALMLLVYILGLFIDTAMKDKRHDRRMAWWDAYHGVMYYGKRPEK